MISFFNGRTRTLGGETSEVFAKVDVAFRGYLHLLKGAYLGVFLAIALHGNEDGWAWPSYATLARETGYSEDTIRRALAHLCKLEINGHRVLLRYQPKGQEGTFQSNRYLLFPSAEEVARYEGQGVAHLGAETGGGFNDRGGKTPPRRRTMLNQKMMITMTATSPLAIFPHLGQTRTPAARTRRGRRANPRSHDVPPCAPGLPQPAVTPCWARWCGSTRRRSAR